jgi:hypothetical protein
LTSYRAEASDTLLVNAPLKALEPQCCYVGCPDCSEACPPDDCKRPYGVDTRRYESGVIRGDNTGKTDYTLALDGPLFERWARLLTENVGSKGKRNWMNASTQEDYDRFRESFLRHALSVLRGDDDEDHHAACVFNLNGMLYTQENLARRVVPSRGSEAANSRSGQDRLQQESRLVPDHAPRTGPLGTRRRR